MSDPNPKGPPPATTHRAALEFRHPAAPLSACEGELTFLGRVRPKDPASPQFWGCDGCRVTLLRDADGTVLCAVPAAADGPPGKRRREWTGGAAFPAPGRADLAPLAPPAAGRAPDGRPRNGRPGDTPRDARQLLAWCRRKESEDGPGLLDHLSAWGRANGHGSRLLNWPADAVAGAVAEAEAWLGASAP